MKDFKFTAIIQKGENGFYEGQIEEIPEAISQGKTIDELLLNLNDALKIVIEYKRDISKESYAGMKIIKRYL
jgi:predicted RNase H-like HicB family nuclease